MALLDAVFFDIDDTLFPTTEFAQRARWNAVKAMVAAGLELPEKLGGIDGHQPAAPSTISVTESIGMPNRSDTT